MLAWPRCSGLGNPGREYAAYAAQPGVSGGGPAGGAERHAVRRAGNARRWWGRARSPAAGAAGQAADVHEFERDIGAALLEKYELAARELIVVYDDLDLPWTSLPDQAERLRRRASRGGIGDPRAWEPSEFARVRLGIHPGHEVRDGAEFVLAPIKRGQRKELDELLGPCGSRRWSP